MGCGYTSTAFSPGDNLTVLLRKLVQSRGGNFDCGESGEWLLVAEILRSYGGTPVQGDTIAGLWEKLRRALGDTACHCGNAEWNSIQSALDSISPGSFAVGDSKYNLIRKLLDANQTPAPPDPDPPEFVSVASNLFTATASPTVNYPVVLPDDIMLAIFSTTTVHNSTGAPPTGWTKLDEVDEAIVDSAASVFWKRAGVSEPASEVWTSIFDAVESGLSVVIAYRGCITSGSPVNASNATFANFNVRHDTGPITTLFNNSMVVGIITSDPPGTSHEFGWDAGISERIDMQAAAASALITVGDKVMPIAGSISLGGNWSPSGDGVCKFIYALTPQPL